MNNKLADYSRDGDKMRTEASAEMIQNLNEYYFSIRDKDLEVPSITDAKLAKLGIED